MNGTSTDNQSTKALRLSKFELGVALTLWSWSALTLAVQNNWGGPDSSSKREWFAGAVVDLFTDPTTQEPDIEDVEERLLQVMEDEFEVVVDDGSPATVAMSVIMLWRETMVGNFGTVDELNKAFEEGKVRGERIEKAGAGSDEEDSVDEESDDDRDDDVEMGDALPAAVREKVVPEMDEDGFVKVVGKRKGK